MPSDSIGETLREARHNKRASLEDASRATKIKFEILEQLEADEFDRLAAPAYTKGFLKLYSEYLGLDSQTIVDAYLRSQGGLRRQGLHVETEKTIRARKPRELQLPLRSVALVVLALTVAVFGAILGKSLLSRRAARAKPAIQQPQPAVVKPAPIGSGPAPQRAVAPAIPTADFDAYYQPKHQSPPELLEPTGK
ncbi:MAG TPA: helix-turn-helix domain-containing protein [Verrucomicrobiae bacterium]|nr:helix-turn-helix domain-containing protein [Verrucomicrobiae bacterium]